MAEINLAINSNPFVTEENALKFLYQPVICPTIFNISPRPTKILIKNTESLENIGNNDGINK